MSAGKLRSMKQLTLVLTDQRVWNVEVEESFSMEDSSQFIEVYRDGEKVLVNKNSIITVREQKDGS